MTQEDAEELLGAKLTPGWRVHEIRRAGDLAGFVIQRGSEIHVWRKPQFTGRWFFPGDLRRVLKGVLGEHGEVTTAVRAINEVGQEFVRRVGFVKVGEANGAFLYRLGDLKHAA